MSVPAKRRRSSDDRGPGRTKDASFSNFERIQNQVATQNISGSVYHGPVYPTYVINDVDTHQFRAHASTEDSDMLPKRAFLMNALRFDSLGSRRDTIRPAHRQTCRWLLKRPEYRKWLDDMHLTDHHGFLWIKGKPGTGKSTITKFAFTRAKETISDAKVISFFFNARGEILEKSTPGMYRTLLFQLLDNLPDLQSVLDQCYVDETVLKTNEFGLYRWEIEALKDLLQESIQRLGSQELLCFVDALDECEEDQIRDMIKFFQSLGQSAVASGIRFRTCFSSRHYPHITIRKSVSLVLEDQEGHHDDMDAYLASELEIGDSEQAISIMGEILKRSSGIFLWVVLVVQILNKEYDRGHIHALKQRLQEIPDDLETLFQDILMRDGQPNDQVILCLQWVLFARRPLNIEELYMGIVAGTKPFLLRDWNPDAITQDDMRRFMVNSSKGLVEETKGDSATVQLIHESVRDFLLKASFLGPSGHFKAHSHERLKQLCQFYYRNAKADNLTSPSQHKYLGQYAVINVLYHSEMAESHGISQQGFLRDFDLNLPEWIYLYNQTQTKSSSYTSDVSLLHVLSKEYLPYLIALELDQAPSVGALRWRYRLLLFQATQRKDKQALMALLSPSSIKENKPEDITISDHELHVAVTRLLRQPNVARGNCTPLSWAASHGEYVVAKCLLASGRVSVNTPGSRDYNEYEVIEEKKTPLQWAVIKQHKDIVQLLLAQKDIKVNESDESSLTALHMAVKDGHSDLTEMLLAHQDIDTKRLDTYGFTALQWARQQGRTEIVELFKAHVRIQGQSMPAGS